MRSMNLVWTASKLARGARPAAASPGIAMARFRSAQHRKRAAVLTARASGRGVGDLVRDLRVNALVDMAHRQVVVDHGAIAGDGAGAARSVGGGCCADPWRRRTGWSGRNDLRLARGVAAGEPYADEARSQNQMKAHLKLHRQATPPVHGRSALIADIARTGQRPTVSSAPGQAGPLTCPAGHDRSHG